MVSMNWHLTKFKTKFGRKIAFHKIVKKCDWGLSVKQSSLAHKSSRPVTLSELIVWYPSLLIDLRRIWICILNYLYFIHFLSFPERCWDCGRSVRDHLLFHPSRFPRNSVGYPPRVGINLHPTLQFYVGDQIEAVVHRYFVRRFLYRQS